MLVGATTFPQEESVLKRDGQHPCVGTIGTIGYVLLLEKLKVEKKFSLCMCAVHICCFVGRGQKWRALSWADISNMINWL